MHSLNHVEYIVPNLNQKEQITEINKINESKIKKRYLSENENLSILENINYSR